MNYTDEELAKILLANGANAKHVELLWAGGIFQKLRGDPDMWEGFKEAAREYAEHTGRPDPFPSSESDDE